MTELERNKSLNNKLKKIKTSPKDIKKINLSEEYALTIIPVELKECINLEELDISYTNITEIPEWIFKFPKIKKLSYLGCKKLILQPQNFDISPFLEDLKIYIGENQDIPDKIYGSTILKSLTIQGKIDKLEDKIGSIKNLELLIIFDTEITSLPDSVGQLNKLKKISFWQPLFLNKEPNQLELDSIFSVLSNCANLKEIELDKNGLENIPSSINKLKSLRSFSAKDNNFTKFPIVLYELDNLEALDLSINQIETIPQGIEKLHKLKTLKLNSNWKNKLNTDNLFRVIDKLDNLEELELWSCQSVTELPEAIGNLKKLKILDIDNNLLTTLPEALFSMKQLKRLRISTNKINKQEIERLKQALPMTKVQG